MSDSVMLPLFFRTGANKPSSNDQDLKRVSAESQEHIMSSRAEALDGHDHVRSSCEAIERSFDLLRERFFRVR